MRLVLAQFLRTLKERDEFDRLLPDLLLSMGYVPLTKPQTGVRQHGVDLAVFGTSPEDGQQELLLFVIKRGDIGRRDWDNPEPTCVRTSLNEVLDVYLNKYIAPEHAAVRKKVIVTTTGDMKQDVEPNWISFKEINASKATFDFWGGEKIADLIEQHMLDEHLFAADDRTDLRKALALAGENEYDYRDLNRLLLRQLGLNGDSKACDETTKVASLSKALRRVHLAAKVCSSWARSEGDTRQALWVAERALLWSWHRVLLCSEPERSSLYEHIADLWISYVQASGDYIEAIGPHLAVRDGMAGYGAEGAELGMVLFEHIGMLSTIGLACLMELPTDPEEENALAASVTTLADSLCSLLANNSSVASPPLDGHIIDIQLGLMFLFNSGRVDNAKEWLADLVQRLDYSFKTKRSFPVGSDRIEDLVELQVGSSGDEELRDSLMRTSWCLATLAAWCVILGMDDVYAILSRGHAKAYPNVCAQLWHPTPEWPQRWYFGGAIAEGETEAPYELPADPQALVERMRVFLRNPRYDWIANSPVQAVGMWALDFIACRHFRMPVPASAWYRLLPKEPAAAEGPATPTQPDACAEEVKS